MNKTQLRKEAGKEFRLRPIPFRVGARGERLADRDDRWLLKGIADAPTRVILVNCVSGQEITVEADNIRERRSPNFLILRSQLTLGPEEVSFEPLFPGSELRQEPLPLASICEKARGTPIASRDALWMSLVGTRVRSVGGVGSLTPGPDGIARVGIMDDTGLDVFCDVDSRLYPQLNLVRSGDRIIAIGTLDRKGVAVDLSDAQLTFA